MSAQLCASSSWIFLSIAHSEPCRGHSSRSTTSAFAPARSASSMRFRKWSSSVSVKVDVLVVQAEVIDAALRRRNPAGHLAGFDDPVHEGMDEGAVALRRDPVLEPLLVFVALDHPAVRVDRHAGPRADRATEAGGGQREPQAVAGALDL